MATTYYKRDSSGSTDWNTNTAWTTTDDVTATANTGTHPIAGDTAIFQTGASDCSISSAGCACAVLTCTGTAGDYGGTLSQAGNMTTTGNVTFVAGMTVTPSTYKWTFSGGAFVPAGKTLYDVTINNATVTLTTTDLTISHDLLLSGNSARLTGSGRTVTMTGGTWSNSASGAGYIDCNLTFNGDVTVGNSTEWGVIFNQGNNYGGVLHYESGTITTTNSTLSIKGGATLDMATHAGFGGWNNVTIRLLDRSADIALTSALDINGSLTINHGSNSYTATILTSDITVAGSITITQGNIAGRTITMDGTGTWSNSASATSRIDSNLTFAGDVTVGTSSNWNVYYRTGTLTYTSGSITTTSSILNLGASTTLNTPTANMSWNEIKNTGTLTLTSSITLAGLFTISGTSVLATSDVTCVGLSLAAAISGTGRTITLTGGTWQSGGGAVTCNLTFAGNVTVSGTVYYSTGTLTYTSGTITTTSSTLVIGNANTTLTTNGMTWNAITCPAMNAKTITLGSALQAGSINLTGTTTHTILACGTNDVTLTGNWTNPKGTTGRTGNNRFIFNGTSVLSGNTNFYDVTFNPGKTITLTSGGVFAYTNSWTCDGTAGSKITFNTTTPETTAQWNPTGDKEVSYVDATDIDSSTGSHTITVTGGSATRCVNWALAGVDYNATAFALTLALKAPAYKVDVDFIATAIALSLSLKAPAYQIDSNFLATTLGLTLGLHLPGYMYNLNYNAAALALTAALNSPAYKVDKNFAATALALNALLNDPTYRLDKNFNAAALALILALKSPKIKFGKDYMASALSLTVALQNPVWSITNPNNCYIVVSSTDPDTLDIYADGVIIGRLTSL